MMTRLTPARRHSAIVPLLAVLIATSSGNLFPKVMASDASGTGDVRESAPGKVPLKTLASITINAPNDAPIDLEKLLRPRVTGISIYMSRHEPDAPRDSTRLDIQTVATLSGDASHLLALSYRSRTTAIIGQDGGSIRYVPNDHPWDGRVGWHAFFPTVEQRLAGKTDRVVGSVYVRLIDRAGPTLAQVRGEASALVATRLETVDVPLPTEAFDENRHTRPAGKAHAPIDLPDGSKLHLTQYEPGFSHRLSYTFSTPDATRFQFPGDLVHPEKGLPVAFVAPVFMKNGKRLTHATGYPRRTDVADPDDPSATGTLSVRPYASIDTTPDTIRFIIARDVRVVPMTVTIHRVELNTIVNVDAPDEADRESSGAID